MDWNDERIETLTRLWREGYSASQVARQLGGVSRSAVIGKVHRLGVAGRDAPSRPTLSGGRQSNQVRSSAGGVRRAQARPPNTAAVARRASFEVPATATMHTLTAHGCRWPIGDPDQPDFGFCGRLRAGPGAYCPGHAPQATRHREMKAKEIEHMVSRFSEGRASAREPADFSLREIA
jgi:GcrA cell cycle regulator